MIILKMSSFSSKNQEIYVELGGCRVRDVEITGEFSIEKGWIWPDRKNYVELAGDNCITILKTLNNDVDGVLWRLAGG